MGSLSMIIVQAYGFTHQSVIYAWVPISAMMLLGNANPNPTLVLVGDVCMGTDHHNAAAT